MMPNGPWFYCLKHHATEPADEGCKAVDRLGPYDTIDEAQHALERVSQRNEAWDDDPRYDDED